MILRRKTTLHGLIDDDQHPDMAALVERIDEQLSELYELAGFLAFGAPANGARLQNFDAVWLQLTFGSSGTDLTVGHQLGRAPVGLINVETPPSNVPTAPVVGQVTFGTLAPGTTTVTLRCGAANKVATVILF